MSDNAPAVMLSDLRRLLEGGLTRGGPGIDRLPERTVEAMVMASLPRSLSALDGERTLHYHAVHMLLWWSGDERLDLTDPGTTRAILVALALYLGNDPGQHGLGCRWRRIDLHVWDKGKPGRHIVGWGIDCGDWVDFLNTDVDEEDSRRNDGQRWWRLHAPLVAAELDDVKALALAVAHVLGVA